MPIPRPRARFWVKDVMSYAGTMVFYCILPAFIVSNDCVATLVIVY